MDLGTGDVCSVLIQSFLKTQPNLTLEIPMQIQPIIEYEGISGEAHVAIQWIRAVFNELYTLKKPTMTEQQDNNVQ